jgi:hypothetical protein
VKDFSEDLAFLNDNFDLSCISSTINFKPNVSEVNGFFLIFNGSKIAVYRILMQSLCYFYFK